MVFFHMPHRIQQIFRRITAMLKLAVGKFIQIDGEEFASAFSYNAFFALFPLIVIVVTIASLFIDRSAAGKAAITFVGGYIPISGDMVKYILDTMNGVVKERAHAGAISFLVLVWVGMQFFTTLVNVTNRAWGITSSKWWHLPIKSFALLGIMVTTFLLSLAVPMLGEIAGNLFPGHSFFTWAYSLAVFFLPWFSVFLSLSLFYRFAPRRCTRFSEVWFSALCATILLQAAQTLFVLYLKRFAAFNAVYGAFGGIMALLLWIYLSGCIFIFGACLCAAQSETRVLSADVGL
jgi:Ca2+-transporting ATPase